ncbi:MAG: lysophospholipid acyltransferase family protein [Paracoccaceae bacterium]
MSPIWQSAEEPEFAPLSAMDWLRICLRGGALAVILGCGVLVALILRLIEAPLHGAARPWTGWVTVAVCRLGLPFLGLCAVTHGKPMRQSGAFVANHSSWLDIFVLNAGAPLIFVSKAEVADWPGIGALARLTGTVFVRRARQEAEAQRRLIESRIKAGQRLLFFPEGTSTDGRRVLPFKPTLFAALVSDALPEAYVQPVSVAYHAAEGQEPRFYGWWGDMEFGPHMLRMLAHARRGLVDVTWHRPLAVRDMKDRKALARASEAAVRAGHPQGEVGSVERGQ